MAKKTAETKYKSNGQVKGSKVITDVPSQDKALTPAELIRREADEEILAQAEANAKELEMAVLEQADAIGFWLKGLFELSRAPECLFRYRDSRFPKDERGHRMNVTRFYPSLKLAIDTVPAKWTPEMIEAKKWAVEKVGMRYVWTQEGEILEAVDLDEDGKTVRQMVLRKDGEEGQTPTNWWDRYEKLKKKPGFLFDSSLFSAETTIQGAK